MPFRYTPQPDGFRAYRSEDKGPCSTCLVCDPVGFNFGCTEDDKELPFFLGAPGGTTCDWHITKEEFRAKCKEHKNHG